MLKKTADTFESINGLFVKFEKGLLCLVLFTMLFVSIWQIVLRNFFSGGMFWADHLLRVCVLWIAFIGASLAYEHKRHIKIDIFTHIIGSASVKTALAIIAELASFVICMLLLAASIEYLQMAATSSRASMHPAIPDWYFRLVIPYAFLAMTLRAPINLYKLFRLTSVRS